MAESNITAALIPLGVPDDCGTLYIPVNSDCEVPADKPNTDYTVLYPDWYTNDKLVPLAGGAILKLTYKNFQELEDVNPVSLFTKDLEPITTLVVGGDKLGMLTTLRNTINGIVKEIGNKDALRRKQELPKIFVSTYLGDDSEFSTKTDQVVAGINKICELKYIPIEIVEYLIEKINTFPDLTTLIGASGVEFADLANQSLEKQIMELFPFYNISENDIVKKRGDGETGGYYTYDPDNKDIYLKLPDLSGKDSFGFAPDIFLDRNFYLELIANSSITRIKFDDFSIPPSILFTGDFPDEFYEGDPLEIIVESNKELDSGYLSIISTTPKDVTVSKVDTYSDAYEVFTAPVLTQPTFKNSKATFDILDEFSSEYPEQLATHLEKYFNISTESSIGFGSDTITINDSSISEVGLASDFDFVGTEASFFPSASTYFGEANRSDVLLLTSGRRTPTNKNDRLYTGTKISEGRQLFTNVRPKIYDDKHIPSTWISTDSVNSASDLTHTFSFSTTEMGVLNFATLQGAKFAFYAKDSDGQIARSPQIINLSFGKPVITEIDPDGSQETAEISPFDDVRLVIRGEFFNAVEKIHFFELTGAPIATFDKGSSEEHSMTVASESIIFSTYVNLQELGFGASSFYEVVVETARGIRSNPYIIEISDGAGARSSRAILTPVMTEPNEFSFSSNGTQIISGIPIDNINSPLIKIKSKTGYFSGKYSVFCYLAVKSSDKAVLSKIDFAEKLEEFTVTVPGNLTQTLSIASGIKYEFTQSLGGDFYKLSNKKAGLKIPGTYLNYNFNSFTSLNNVFYLIITGKEIADYKTTGLASTDYRVLQLGLGADERAFVNPPYIVGMVAQIPGTAEATSTITLTDKYAPIITEFGNPKPTPTEISTFNKLSKLAIIFKGGIDNNKNRRYTFFIGNKKINNKLVGSILELPGNELVAFFEDIKISEQGSLNVYVDKKDKDFDVNLSSQSVIKTASFVIESDNFEYDPVSSTLTVINDISEASDGSSAGLITNISSIDKLNEMFANTGSGIGLNSVGTTLDFISDVNLNSNFDLLLSSDSSNLKLLRNIQESTVSILDKNTLNIPGGTEILKSYTVFYSDVIPEKVIAFSAVTVTNANAISFNIPSIVSIFEGNNITSGSNKGVVELTQIKAGKEYTVKVRSSDKRFVFVFNELVIVKPKNVKRSNEKDVWDAIIKAPKLLAGQDCPKICVSIANASRNTAKLQLGNQFVVDIPKKMLGILGGVTKKKIPNLDDLKQLIQDFPLRFININLDKVSIPVDLINSFCDMSFHLTADLKIALNGFQILMIPVQVIFCIIDVICALLNPFKVAKAVIRLFQCLYDLVLLLPQISIPVMFLQLILHLLQLLECIFEKILYIATAINAIIEAIQSADGLWDGLKALEEVLSEFFLDLNVQLSILDPIVSILAIFLQLLGLAFRFPCSITDDDDQSFCIDTSMVSGLVLGKAMNDDETYNFNNLIPVAQSYSEKTLIEAIEDRTSDPLLDPADADLVATEEEGITFLDSMVVDPLSLRSTFGGNPLEDAKFNVTFAASATKSKKGFGKPTIVKFEFNERGRNGFFNNRKIIDPLQTLDGPIYLLGQTGNTLKIETGAGKNFISPIDGEEFINMHGDTASVKPLTLSFELPVYEMDNELGITVQTGTETVTRTFDDIPKMSLLDDAFNLYFIEPDGINFKDGVIDSILARCVSFPTATKLKTSKEDIEVDTDDDDENDEEAPVFDFPQLHFFDMRAISEDIQQKCFSDSFNSFALENDPADIAEIVTNGQKCVDDYKEHVSGEFSRARTSMQQGIIPTPIDLKLLQTKNSEFESCLNARVDEICIYAINSLNTQFKIIEDTDLTPLEQYPDLEQSEEILDEFAPNTPALTGAKEYASGIGDSVDLKVDEVATIQITPRDAYDNVIPGDLSNKIIVDITSDSTGTGTFVLNEFGEKISKIGTDYFATLTATKPGIITLRGSICNKTIQAVTYSGIASQLGTTAVDCVPQATSSAENIALGNLTKIDRILTVFFESRTTVALSTNEGDLTGSLSGSAPQTFGTQLEN